MKQFNRKMVRGALRAKSGDRLMPAQDLHISRSYLHRLLKQLNIPDEQPAEEKNLSAVKS